MDKNTENIENITQIQDKPTNIAEKEKTNELPQTDIISESEEVSEKIILDDEILKELDIIEPQASTDTIKDENLSTNTQSQEDLKSSVNSDFLKIQNLIQIGFINPQQGQILKKQVLKKAFDKLVQDEKARINENEVIEDKNKVFDEFCKTNPDFFAQQGRKEVLNYLKNANSQISSTELSKISNLVRTIEKSAIDRYMQKISHQQTLQDSNSFAKKKLTANAQNTSSTADLGRIFTREQIGKMSSSEFAKYENSIMTQLKKGLIK